MCTVQSIKDANQVALTSDEMRACDKQGGALVHLQTYLEAQKRIFETVA